MTQITDLEGTVNVATLPGIETASYAMPDAHWGYGCLGPTAWVVIVAVLLVVVAAMVIYLR